MLAEDATVAATVAALKSAKPVYRKAKDILRAARLTLLPPDNPHVRADLDKIDARQEAVADPAGARHRRRCPADRRRLPPRLRELSDRREHPDSVPTRVLGAQNVSFGFSTLALVAVVGMAGPLLASVPRLRIPVVIGELAVGIAHRQNRIRPRRRRRSDLHPAGQHRVRVGDVRGRHPRPDPRHHPAVLDPGRRAASRPGRCGGDGPGRRAGHGLPHRPRRGLRGADGVVVGGPGVAGHPVAGASTDPLCWVSPPRSRSPTRPVSCCCPW